jgi:hypothetical protein
MIFINATKTDITCIVDEVSNDLWAWAKLPDGSYPLLVVIKNAINMVRGSQLEPELYKQNNIQRAKFGLPPEEISGPKPPQLPDEFMQKLYSFIELLPILKTELNSIRAAFGCYIRKPNCDDQHAHLTEICAHVREFLSLLGEEQSNDLKVKARGGTLKSALRDFKNQEDVVGKAIKRFCEDHGAKIREHQPADAREDIQSQLDALIGYSESALDKAGRLYNQLGRP